VCFSNVVIGHHYVDHFIDGTHHIFITEIRKTVYLRSVSHFIKTTEISLRFGGLSSNVTGPRNRCSSAFLLQQPPPAIQEVHANSTSGTKFFSPISPSTAALKQEGARIGPAVHPGGVFRTLFHSSQVYASLRQASEGDERWS